MFPAGLQGQGSVPPAARRLEELPWPGLCPHSSILVQQAESGDRDSALGTALPLTPPTRAQQIWHFSLFQATGRLAPLSQQGKGTKSS